MSFREDLEPTRLLDLEEEVLARWSEEDTFRATLARRADAQRFVFYEGPPTANGRPGIHHVLARAVKDFACRLKTMQGYLVDRRGGWDTHGLPVEIEAERRLGLEGKKAIEELGIERFNAACRESVFRYVEDWNALTRRMGYWVDLDHPYVTCDRDYVESLWWILAELHGRGLLVRGHKVLPYCPRCSTPLSSHEVGLGFRDVQDPSVTVRLELEGSDEALLVWTTTPWTLPSNVAVAVDADLDYTLAAVKAGEHEGARVWVAEARRHDVLDVEHDVVRTVPGRELVGRRYRRLLDWYELPEPVEGGDGAFRVVAGDFVTTEDGTGLVHMAPAYGQDDAEVARREGLPVLHPVDATGRFLPGSPVAGVFVKEADKEILRHLKEQGSLWHRDVIVHAYPHCWRCDSPLLYYARDSWYLTTTAFREAMLENNAQVTWHPANVGTGRFGQWLEGNVDWAISRDRYWGTPLPVWVCDACDAETAIGAIADLEARSGSPLEDPHRPFVDEHTWACEAEGCQGTMRRTPEVADAWFDSGSMPFAQWHYPFENEEQVAEQHPADFISEGVDQTRGWFYTLLAVSTMLTGKPAYRTCVSLDLILDEGGKKMSKSRGNIVDPFQMIDRYGADVVRWHLLVRPLGVPLRYDEQDLVEIRNRFFGTLLHAYAFFATYANVDGYDGADEQVPLERRPMFDRWLVSRLHALFRDVGEHLERYDTAHAGQRIADFVVEDLSNWYIRRNRRRFFRSEMGDDKRSAYQTLHAALLSVTQLAAPFAPFVTDALYTSLADGLPGALPSVHMATWPLPDAGLVDEDLGAGMAALRRVVSLGHSVRDEAGLRVRQPLARVAVAGLGRDEAAFLRDHADVLLDELNVKRLDIEEGAAGVALRVSLDKKQAARRLGRQTPHAMRALDALGADEAAALLERLREGPTALDTPEGPVELKPADVRVVAEAEAGRAAAWGGGLLVSLDTELTPELEEEGLAREVLRRLQTLRKEAGLAVEDRIRLRWDGEGDVAAAVEAWQEHLAEELLAVAFERAEDGDGLAPLDVPGRGALRVALEKA